MRLLISIVVLILSVFQPIMCLAAVDMNTYCVDVSTRHYAIMDEIAEYIKNTDVSITAPNFKYEKSDTLYDIRVYDKCRDLKFKADQSFEETGSYVITVSPTTIIGDFFYMWRVEGVSFLSIQNLTGYFTSCSASRVVMPDGFGAVFIDEEAISWRFEVCNGQIINAVFLAENGFSLCDYKLPLR